MNIDVHRYLVSHVLLAHLNHLQNLGMKQGSGWIELVLVEAKDLVAADIRGTSDPYVRVHYGNIKKRTKVRQPFYYSDIDMTDLLFFLMFFHAICRWT